MLPESRFQFVTRQKSNRKATIYKKNSTTFSTSQKSISNNRLSFLSLSLSKSRVSSGSDQRAQVFSGEFLTLTPASARVFFVFFVYFLSCLSQTLFLSFEPTKNRRKIAYPQRERARERAFERSASPERKKERETEREQNEKLFVRFALSLHRCFCVRLTEKNARVLWVPFSRRMRFFPKLLLRED